VCRVRAHAIKAVEIRLGLALDAVVLQTTVAWIGEVDPTVGSADDVVRAVQLLALVVRRDRGDAPVALGACDLAGRVLAGKEAPFAVRRKAVGHVAGLAERAG